MACGKTGFCLLAIMVITSCAPAEKDPSSSREGDGPPNHEPPPYHQSPMNDNQEHQDNQGRQDSPQQQDKEVNEQGVNSNKQEGTPTLEIPPSSFNNSEDHQDGTGFSGPNDSFSFHMSDNSNDDRAGLFGFDSMPNFGQMFFGGSNESNPLDQLFQNGFHQIVDAIGMFIPGSNNTGLPNLFSGFMPHSRNRRSIVLPGDARENDTEDSNPHDRCLFSLFSHFLNTNSANSYASIGCNYTTQAGYSCSGCREQLICNPNNVGRIRICPRNAPYCYNGVCGSIVNTTACTTTTTG